ncbi:MAG: hypothetical protein KJS91_10895 [Planctomycetes bacterium]|jgi:hypothetical protein|nr:hypothetical protein [Planctomycetota bacterium]
MQETQSVDIDREDATLLRTLIALWSGLFAMGAGLYAAVVFFCWPK